MKRLSMALFFGAIAAVAFVSWSGAAKANDEPLLLTLVNMTPGEVSDSRRRCSAAILRGIRREGRDSSFGINIRRLGESAVRQTMGEGDFLRWERDAFSRVNVGPDGTDTFILFDCRPDEQVFRALVIPPNPHSAIRTELRRVPIEANYEWILADLMTYAWW